jgi:hypothetical protein
MTERRFRRIDAMLRRRQPDLTILAEDVYKPHNLSAMLRSADAVGIGTVHAVTPTGGLPTFNATSASAEKWVRLRVHADLDAALARCGLQGMQVLAAHFSEEARRLPRRRLRRADLHRLRQRALGRQRRRGGGRRRPRDHPDARHGAVAQRLGGHRRDPVRGAAPAARGGLLRPRPR